MKLYKKINLIVASALALNYYSAMAQVSFQNETLNSGVIRNSESWGAAWGDWNGDSRPDIFLGNHRNRPDIFQNNGDGTFSNVTLQADASRTFVNSVRVDTHGASWSDFDNDGDQDLSVTTTGAGFRFMINTNGENLNDQSWVYDLQDDGAGRLPVWFDFTRDGLLDIAQVTTVTTKMRQQNAGSDPFTNVASTLGMSCKRNNYAQISDLNNDGVMDFICGQEGVFPQSIYSTSSVPFQDITSIVPVIGNINDTAIADFNNDLLPDFFFSRGRLRPTQAKQASSNSLEAWIVSSASTGVKGFSFQSTGSVTFSVDSEQPEFLANDVSVGSANSQPAAIPFTLNPGNVSGMASGNDINIGYDNSTQTWTVLLSAGGNGRSSVSAYFTVTANTVSQVAGIGTTLSDGPLNPKMLLNNGNSFTDAAQVGLGVPVSCNSVATADFDNDMDIDVYMVCRGGVENLANRLYINQGNGSFNQITLHGAEGVIGIGLISGAGSGESVIAADYDVDGRVDLLTTNGLKLLKSVRTGGPVELFRNTTADGNNWIEIDLIGVTSNRDATGAKVYATAGGVTQLREQNGGYHRWSQHDRRIHFGLAGNTQVDVEVHWPNGAIESFNGLQANRLYTATEGANAQVVTLGPVPGFPAPQAGDECGAPVFTADVDRGLFVWRDCGTDNWHARAAAGHISMTAYSGLVTTDQTFSGVIPFDLEAGDSVDNNDPSRIVYDFSMMNTNLDGFDFSAFAGATTCFSAQLPSGATLLLGSSTIPVPSAIDLTTLAACTDTAVSVADSSASETDGVMTFDVRLSVAANTLVLVEYQTQSGTAIAALDYTSVTGTLMFNPGETLKTISVPVIDDGVSEGSETFLLNLVSVTNAILNDGSAVGTLSDGGATSCGAPVFDSTSEKAMFIWQDCPTGDWIIRVTAGGDSGGVDYVGNLTSDAGFAGVIPFSLEASDTLTTITNRIDYILRVWNAGIDGVDVSLPVGSPSCLSLDSPTGIPVLMGSTRQAINLPIDLVTMLPCQASGQSVSVADIFVSEAAGQASFVVSLSAASTQTIAVDYMTVDNTAIAGLDYIAAAGTVTFSPGQVTQSVTVSVIQDGVIEGQEFFTLALSNVMNAQLSDATATATISDNISACGAPVFDVSNDKALFVWQDCSVGTWHVRATAGGDPAGADYSGLITSDLGFTSLTTVNIEGHDTLDNTSNSTQIDYRLRTWNSALDGFDFMLVNGAAACFDVNTISTNGGVVLLGAAKNVISAPFDLGTLASCQ